MLVIPAKAGIPWQFRDPGSLLQACRDKHFLRKFRDDKFFPCISYTFHVLSRAMEPRQRFLNACKREPVDRPPVWMMRQAGRHLPEYLELREKYDFMTRCLDSDLAVEISLQPWRRYGVDAVVVFSDILLPVSFMGPKLELVEQRGPVFTPPLRTQADLDALDLSESQEKLTSVLKTLQRLRSELQDNAALLGFVGAPWTIACYLVEGEGKQNGFGHFKKMVQANPELAKTLMSKINQILIPYVKAQVAAGADAIQIFDSWGGNMLDKEAYREFSLPYITELCQAVNETGAVSIAFTKKSDHLLEALVETGAQVVGIGASTNMTDAIERIGNKVALQGNLDELFLLESPERVEKETKKLLNLIQNRPGHIVNLGHGILPQTKIESVEAFVETVKQSCHCELR